MIACQMASFWAMWLLALPVVGIGSWAVLKVLDRKGHPRRAPGERSLAPRAPAPVA